MNKYITSVLMATFLVLALCLSFVACDGGDTTTDTSADTQASGEVVTDAEGKPVTTPDGDTVQADGTTATSTPGTTEPAAITLTFNGLSCDPSEEGAVEVNAAERAFVITKAGTYVLTGDLSGGQVRVSAQKTDEVILIFKNFNASNTASAPLYITSCDKCIIELAAGSVNTLTDAETYTYPDPTTDKPNACIYSADDLTIRGDGTLNVVGNYNNGIGCKNDLRIKSGTITVSAPNNILKGNDSVTIDGGKVTLSGGEDAIKSDTTDRTDKGFVLIEGDAEVTITCSDDAIQATQSVTVAAGTSVTVTAGGNAINCPGTINANESAMNIVAEGAADAETPVA